jgi:diguanylate cyclase
MAALSPSVRKPARRAALDAARAAVEAAHAARVAGDHRLGVEHGLRAKALAEAAGQKRLTAEALSVLALNELRLGDIESATGHGLQALALVRRPADAAARAQVCCTLVMAYNEMGLYADALVHALQAIEAARLTDDASLLSWALNRAGITYHGLGDDERSEPLLLQALDLARTINGGEETFSALNNLCSNLLESARAETGAARHAMLVRALPFGRDALELARNSGNAHREAVAIGNLASVQLELADYPQAIACIERQAALAEHNGYRAMALAASINRAELERKKGALGVAVRLFEQALAKAHEVSDHAVLFELHKSLYESHKESGDTASALRHIEAMLPLERQALQQRADRQARLLLNRIEIENFHAMAERARLDAEVQRLRAARLEAQNALLSSKAIELGRHALEDQLTGLANRRRIDHELPAQLSAAQERGTALSVAAIDLDHFKAVNDRHGHGVGDDVLRAVARLLVANTRSTDLCARMGGEEFLVVFIGTPPAAALEICERLRQAIERYDWRVIAKGLNVTVSIGLCEIVDGDQVRPLLERADASLYAAKRAGRNRVVLNNA